MCYHLEKHSTVFADVLHNDSEDPQARVEMELISADVIVFLRTPASDNSEWVAREQHLASLTKKKTITINIDSSDNWEAVGFNIAAALRTIDNDKTYEAVLQLHKRFV